MGSSPEEPARALLAELEGRLATHDLDRMTEFFTDDVVLIGDAVENFDRESTVAYLQLMADMAPTVRWNWERVSTQLQTSEALVFAAAGTMTFNDEAGEPMGAPEPFRVTCLAVETPDGWRLRHFHGSVPQAD